MSDPMSEDQPLDFAVTSGTVYGVTGDPSYSGVLSFLRRRYQPDATGADVAVMGVPYDLAVTNRPGTRFGPRAIRQASSQIAWSGGPWRWAPGLLDRLAIVDTGDAWIDWGKPHLAGEAIEAAASARIATGAKLLSLGGDHFITGALLRAHAGKHGPLALIQFDSHSDTWREAERRIDHGTMFFHAAEDGVIDTARSIQVGLRSGNSETHGFEILDADFTADHAPADIAARIARRVGQGPAYLTFDIDFLDPAFAPGTGTPVCGGPNPNIAERVIHGLAGLDIVGADVVEVSPPYDVSDITALAGATVAMNICGLWGEAKR